MLRHFSRSKRGQIAVALIMIIVPLLGAIGLGADLAVLYFNWMQLQKGADAAVLAAAGYLPNHTSQAQSTAQTYANRNGVKTGEITSTTIAPDNLSISMSTSRTVPYYFLTLLGVSSGSVKPTATAGIKQNTESARGLIPVGLPCSTSNCNYTAGTLYHLVQAGTNGGGSWNVGPGNWGRLALGAQGATQFLSNLENGYQGSINVGDQIDAEQGQVNGPTDAGVSLRVSDGMAVNGSVSNPTLATVPAYDPRLVAIPLVDFTGVNGNSVTVPVIGFALMWLDSYTSQGPNKTLNAYFLGTVPITSVPSSINTFGILHPILLQ